MTKDEVKTFVFTYIQNHPGCLATDVGHALVGHVNDPLLGRYNHVAWAVRRLRHDGLVKDDMPKCSECHRIINRAPRPLYVV